MKRLITFFLFILIFQGIHAQVNIYENDVFLIEAGTLKEAFDYINDGSVTGAIKLEIIDNCNEIASCVLNASGSAGGACNYTSVLIYPGITGKTVSGTLASPLIDLNGADNVTINGSMNASGSSPDLTLKNNSSVSTAGTSTIRFRNDATNNVVQYCNIRGSSADAAGGVLFFSTTNQSTGNDGNAINYNTLSNSSDASRPVNIIYSEGTVAKENSGNTVNNNKFYDFLNRSVSSNGINLGANSTAWTITGNNFYETSSFVPASGGSYNIININNTAGTGFIITGNSIGGSAEMCGGTAWTKTNAFNNPFNAIYINAGTGVASSLQNNTIRNISWANSGAAAWSAIFINSGAVNIGTSTGNTIGDETTTGSLTITGGANNTNVYGINITGSGTINCQNNIIGSFTASNSVSTAATNLYAVYKEAVAGTLNLNNNFIGSSSVSNSLNITSTSSSNSQNLYGIYNAGTGNTTISGNRITSLRNGTTSSSGTAAAIFFSGGSGTNSVNANLINSISTASGSSTASVRGIHIAAGVASFFNNIISLGGNTETVIYGIYETGGASDNVSLYFNTVYIGGVPTAGSNNSYALFSNTSANTRNFRNNIFNNARSNSGATGKHYSAFFNATGGTLTCDFNDYYSSGTGGVLGHYVADVTILPVVTGQDANSKAVSPSFASPGGTASSDYLPAEATLASGTTLSILTDYNGVTRGATPTMGALELGACTNPTSGGTIAASQSGCNPFDPAGLTNSALPSGYIGTLEYKWMKSTTGSSSGFTDIASSNSTTYDPGSLTQTHWFKRIARVSCQADWTGAAESNVIEITVNQPPVANAITGLNTMCMGNTVSLTSYASGTATLTYTWSSSNTAVATVNNSGLVTSVGPGTSNITYTVTDGNTPGCQATSPVFQVTVNDLPLALPVTGGNKVCMTNSLQLNSNASGTPTLTYSWLSEDTFIATVDNNGIVTPVSAGFANIRYTVTDGSSTACQATSAKYRVDIYNLPVAGAITGSNSVCEGGTITLSSHATGTGALTYTWNSSNTSVATIDNSGFVTALAAGTTNITYTVSDGIASPCQSVSPAFAVTVNGLPSAGAITGGNAVCMGSTLALSANATGTPTLTYTWNSSNTAVATVSNTGVVTPVSIGTTNISYTVTDGSTSSCQATSPALVVTVNALPVAGAITGSNVLCQGGTVTLSPNATGTPALTYTWLSSNTSVATVDNNGVVTGISAGTSNIIYTVTDGSSTACQATSPAFNVTVNGKPVAGTITGTASVCPGGSVTLSSNATGTPVLTYTWSSSNTSVATVNNSGAVTAISSGSTEITYTVTDGSTTSCSNVSPSFTFTVNSLPDITLSVSSVNTVCPGTGTNISVALSETGVDYQLRNDSDDSNIGSPVAGTGGTIDLPTGNLVAATTFNLLAVRSATGCSAELTEKKTVTVATTASGGTITGVNNSIVYGSSTGNISLTAYTGNIVNWQKKYVSGSWEDITNTNDYYSEIPVSIGSWQFRVYLTIGTCSEAYSDPFTLEVTPKALTITASDQSKVYGSAFTFLGTEFTTSGLTGSDAVSAVTLASSAVNSAADVNGSPYTIIPSTASGTGLGNYTISYANGSFTVTKASLTISADNKTRAYNSVNPALTYTITGFANSETEAVIDALPLTSTTALQDSPVGTYPVTVTGGSDDNYTFVLIDGTLTIIKTDQTISFTAIPEKLLVKDSFTLAASSTSGLPVSFESLDPQFATVSGAVIKGVSSGNARIRAYNNGDPNHNAAEITGTTEIYSTHSNIMNLFTPNNDGINDHWELPEMDVWGKCDVKVYNRWGQLVFDQKDYDNLWDGTSNGKALPEGPYYFIIDTENAGVVKGTVNIVR